MALKLNKIAKFVNHTLSFMLNIKFTAIYGDEQKAAEISEPSGNSGQYHFILDGFYQGAFWVRDNVWVFYGNGEKDLTFEDVQILGEIVAASAMEDV